MVQSALEAMFENTWRIMTSSDETLSEPTAEFRFHADRKWRFDFAWPALRVAVECEGGTFAPGRHQGRGRHLTSKGFHEDCNKYNIAAVLGWRVLRFDAQHLKKNPAGCVELVIATLKERNP